MQTQTAMQQVVCDGCGQGTTSAHIARRLDRLEQTTRYRPIHIQAVFLSAQSPAKEEAFLYAGKSFQEEAAALLRALQIESVEREADAVLSEFQRKGYLLTHVLECAPEDGVTAPVSVDALMQKLPSVLRRLRTSLKPRKVFVISREIEAVCGELKAAQIGGEIVLDGAAPFDLNDAESVARLRFAL
jgi:hypothetical protein